ncbi:MAG: GGDEF domain-containing protein [Bacillota bacterium]
MLPLALVFTGVMAGLVIFGLSGLGRALVSLPETDRLVAAAGIGTRLFLLALIGLATLVALTTVIVDRQVREPADRLLKVLRRVAKGDLPEPLRLEGPDDFGGLVAGFNELVESLRERDRLSGDLHRRLEGELNVALAESMTDGLTGVYNRRFFRVRLAEEVARALRYNHPLSLIVVDIDRFSSVNRERGRESGDRTLAEVALVLKAGIRACDIVARCGGEEFALILPETDTAGAHFLARRLRQKVADHAVWADGRTVPPITASLGIACFPQDCRTADEMFERAWRAVLYAKEMGRNQVRHYAEVVAAGFQVPSSLGERRPPGTADD